MGQMALESTAKRFVAFTASFDANVAMLDAHTAVFDAHSDVFDAQVATGQMAFDKLEVVVRGV